MYILYPISLSISLYLSISLIYLNNVHNNKYIHNNNNNNNKNNNNINNNNNNNKD